jgi:hypothetical protein
MPGLVLIREGFDDLSDDEFEQYQTRLNDGIQIAIKLALDEGFHPSDALYEGWRRVGIEPSTIPISMRKLTGMSFPTTLENARRARKRTAAKASSAPGRARPEKPRKRNDSLGAVNGPARDVTDDESSGGPGS